MNADNYWIQRRFSRRHTLSGAGMAFAGLAGAALVGCGSDDKGSDKKPKEASDGKAPASGAASGGAPALPRAPGFPGEKFGQVPVNKKERVMGGTLRMPGSDRALGGRTMDPDVSGFFAPAEYVNDRLVYPAGWTEELKFDLLQSVEWKDSTNVVLRIRPGVKTHNRAPTNGRVVDADDVAFSINRKAGVLDPKAAQAYPRRAYLTGLQRAEAVDPVTIRVKFTSPNASFMNAFSDIRQGIQLKELEKWDFKDMTKFPGFGPWMVTEDIDSVRATFMPHPDYYRKDEEGGRPSFDKMVLQAYPDRAAALAAFITGETDHLASVAPQEDAQVTASVKGALRYRSPGATITHVNINPNKVAAFKDQRVRKAWLYARDFKAIGDPISAPGWMYSGPFHPMHDASRTSDEIKKFRGYNPDTKTADIADGVKLLEAAGYPQGKGISFKIWSSGATGRNFESGERVRDQLMKAYPAMRVTLDPAPDIATFNKKLNDGDFESLAHDFAQVPDAALNGMTYYHSAGGRNYAKIKEAWIDEAMEKILQTLDSRERKKLVSDFEERYIDWGPPILNNAVVMTDHAFQANIGGVDLIAGTWQYFYTLGYGGLQRWLWRTK